MLLDRTEWEVEQVLHLGRLVLWTGLLSLLVFGWGVSPAMMLASIGSLGLSALSGDAVALRVEPGGVLHWLGVAGFFASGLAAWLAYWAVLRRTGAWRWLRFVVIVVDVMSLIRFAVAERSGVATGVGAGVPADLLGAIVPAVLVLHVLTGAVRLNPFAAGAAGITALLGQVATGLLLELPAALGMNLLFVLRGMALRAA